MRVLRTSDNKTVCVSPETIKDWNTITALTQDVGDTNDPIPIPATRATVNALLKGQTSAANYFRVFDLANYLDAKEVYYNLLTELVARINKSRNKEALFARYKDHLPQAAYFAGSLRESIPHLGVFYDAKANVWVNAIRNGHLDAFRRLLSFPEENPAAGDNRAIRWAPLYGDAEVVRLLFTDPRVDHAVLKNAPIGDAARYGYTEVVRLLLALPKDRGVDPSADDNYAIECAACKGHVEVVRLLLADPRIDISVDKYSTIQQKVEYNGHAEMVCLLKENANYSVKRNRVI